MRHPEGMAKPRTSPRPCPGGVGAIVHTSCFARLPARSNLQVTAEEAGTLRSSRPGRKRHGHARKKKNDSFGSLPRKFNKSQLAFAYASAFPQRFAVLAAAAPGEPGGFACLQQQEGGRGRRSLGLNSHRL